MSLDDSVKPVEHYEGLYIVSKFASASLSIYLSITLFTWVTNFYQTVYQMDFKRLKSAHEKVFLGLFAPGSGQWLGHP